MITRRAVLAGAGATALAAALPELALAARGDAAIFGRMAPLEQTLAFAYGAAVNAGSDRVRELATGFVAHEAEHVAALNRELEAMGSAKAQPPKDPGVVDAVARSLGITPVLTDLRTPDEILTFLLAFEEAVMAAWINAHRKLADARLLQLATGILACQAQHAVLLRRALGRELLPEAFAASA